MIILSAFDPHNVLDWVNSGGIIGILLFIIISGTRKMWVFGWQFRDLEERYRKVEESNSMWMQVALRGVNVTEQIIKTSSTSDGDKRDS